MPSSLLGHVGYSFRVSFRLSALWRLSLIFISRNSLMAPLQNDGFSSSSGLLLVRHSVGWTESRQVTLRSGVTPDGVEPES